MTEQTFPSVAGVAVGDPPEPDTAAAGGPVACLREVRAALADLAADGLSGVSAGEAMGVVEVCGEVARLVAAVEIAASAVLVDGPAWRARTGTASVAHWMAARSGTSVHAAAQRRRVGQRLGTQPQVAAALAGGRLSAAQAAVVSDAVVVDATAEVDLVAAAEVESLAGLRARAERVAAAARGDDDTRERAAHTQRSLRSWVDTTGWHLEAHGPVAAGINIDAEIRAWTTPAFDAARRHGHRDPFPAYAFDALALMARAARGTVDGAAADKAGRRAKIIVRVDHTALVRGHTHAGETCDIPGVGPVPVTAVRDLLATGDPFLAAVVTRGRDVVTVAHPGRRVDAYQRTALEWRDPTCVVEGCANAFCEIDHTTPYTHSHHTALWDLDRLCGHHHRQKTRHQWALVAGRGPRPIVAPTDPRHPRHPDAGHRDPDEPP